MINNGIELMNTDGVLAALSIQGILFLFLTPTIFVLLVILISRRVKNKVKHKKMQKELGKTEHTNTKEEAERILNNPELAMKKLQDLTVTPSNMKDYRTLDISFDNNGNIIKTNNKWGKIKWKIQIILHTMSY